MSGHENENSNSLISSASSSSASSSPSSFSKANSNASAMSPSSALASFYDLPAVTSPSYSTSSSPPLPTTSSSSSSIAPRATKHKASAFVLTAEERHVLSSMNLDALTLRLEWNEAQFKSLLLLVACLLPTKHLKASFESRGEASSSSSSSSSSFPEALAACVEADANSVIGSSLAWERALLRGLALAFKLPEEAALAAVPLLGKPSHAAILLHTLPFSSDSHSSALSYSSTTTSVHPSASSSSSHVAQSASSSTSILQVKVTCLLMLLHCSLLICGGYDSRFRVLLRSLSSLLSVRWLFFQAFETRYAAALVTQIDEAAIQAQLKEKASSTSSSSSAMHWLKIGAAALVGGALIGVTGGLLAAPLLAGGLAGIGLATASASVGALVASSTGLIVVSTLFGAAGAGLSGYKMNKRISSLKEFEFVRLDEEAQQATQKVQRAGSFSHSDAAPPSSSSASSRASKQHEEPAPSPKHKKSVAETRGMAVIIAFNGFLLDDSSGYTRTWLSLVRPSSSSSSSHASAAPANKESNVRGVRSLLHPFSSSSSQSSFSAAAGVPSTSLSSFSFHRGLAFCHEVNVLHWETPILLSFGSALKSLSLSAYAKGYLIGQVKSFLIGSLLSAIYWPMQMTNVLGIIDSSYSLVVDRSEKAAAELADVIEARQAGHRPLSLIGFSNGARTIFRALEILADRRDRRLALNAVKQEKEWPEERLKQLWQQEKQAELAAAAQASSPSVPQPPLSSSQSGSDALSVLDSASKTVDGQQYILTAKGYRSLPSDSLLLNAEPLENVYLLGANITCNLQRWLRVRSMVSGRLVNGYSTSDWLLTLAYSLQAISLSPAGNRPITKKMSAAVSAASARRKQAEKEKSASSVLPPHLQQPASSTSAASTPHAPRLSPRITNHEQVEIEAEAAGLSEEDCSAEGDVDDFGIENVNLTAIIDNHLDYQNELKMRRCLLAAGFES